MRSDNSNVASETSPTELDTGDPLDGATIAGLSAETISRMDSDELLRVIRAARLPFVTEENDAHLTFQDQETLERLANLARRCCQSRASASRLGRETVQGVA
jgi:hypothetical protein